MARFVIVIFFIFNILVTAQINYTRVSFEKGTPDSISLKWDKAEFAQIDAGNFYKAIYIINKLPDSFPNEVYFLYKSFDNSFAIRHIEFVNNKSNLYSADIPLITQDEDELSRLDIKIDKDRNFLEYTWGDSVTGFSQKPKIVKKYSLKPGKYFPLRILKSKNKTYNLDKIKDKIIVINWWATGCVPCVFEIPGLNKLTEIYKGKDVIFLAIIWDNENMDKFLSKHPFKYIQTFSNDEIKNILGGAFPRNIILDKKHKIVYNQLGGSEDTGDRISLILEKLLP